MALPPDFLSRGGAGGGGQRMSCPNGWRAGPAQALFAPGFIMVCSGLCAIWAMPLSALKLPQIPPKCHHTKDWFNLKKKSIKVQTSAPKSNQSNSCGSEIKNAQKTLER